MANRDAQMLALADQVARVIDSSVFLHELQSPLHWLRNWLSEPLEREADGDRELREDAVHMLRRLEAGVDRLCELVSLLYVSEMQDLEPIGLNDALTEAMRELQMLSGRQAAGKIRFSSSVASTCSCPFAMVHLTYVIEELVANAFQANAKKVSIATGTDSGRVFIEVMDDGEGLSERIAGRLGEPFVTSRAHARHLGLGTFVVKAIADRYGSETQWMRNRTGGTTVRIVLPATEG